MGKDKSISNGPLEQAEEKGIQEESLDGSAIASPSPAGSPEWKSRAATGLDVAFGPSKMSDFLPSMKEIPERFKKRHDPFVRVVSSIFFSGGSVKDWVAKPGIDKAHALNHFRTVLGSWEPKHEHKEAGCAYMLATWFEPESLGISEGPKGAPKAQQDHSPSHPLTSKEAK